MTPTRSEWGYITCLDCGREFDLTDGPDADEWHHGHDCDQSIPCPACGTIPPDDYCADCDVIVSHDADECGTCKPPSMPDRTL
jgi:hypothetical protein